MPPGVLRGDLYLAKVRNSTCPLARDKWIFRRATKIANIVVRRTTWIAAGSVTRQRSSYFGDRFERYSVNPISSGMTIFIMKSTKTTTYFCSLHNAAAFSQRRPPSVVECARWGDRGISRCYCADWLLSSCGHRISRSSGQSARVVRVVSVCVFFV